MAQQRSWHTVLHCSLDGFGIVDIPNRGRVGPVPVPSRARALGGQRDVPPWCPSARAFPAGWPLGLRGCGGARHAVGLGERGSESRGGSGSRAGWAQQPCVGLTSCGVVLERRQRGAGDYICVGSRLGVTNDSARGFSPTRSACSGRLSHEQLTRLVRSLFGEELAPVLPGVHPCAALS